MENQSSPLNSSYDRPDKDPETYLGDSVYATYCANAAVVWLDCRGQEHLSIGPTGNPGICLGPTEFDNLQQFIKRFWRICP